VYHNSIRKQNRTPGGPSIQLLHKFGITRVEIGVDAYTIPLAELGLDIHTIQFELGKIL
jgi:hypothetical protein